MRDWFGSIGGFWRTSDGVRDPQFAADEGGQLTATLKHEGRPRDNSMLYARYLDDKNQFITPIPVIQHGSGRLQRLSGLRSADRDLQQQGDPARAARRLSRTAAPNADLANGRGAKMVFVGANYDQDLGGGWSITDKFLVNGGDVDTNALFSGSNPATLDRRAVHHLHRSRWLRAAGGLGDGHVRAAAARSRADQSVIHQGWWFIHKNLRERQQRLPPEQGDCSTATR